MGLEAKKSDKAVTPNGTHPGNAAIRDQDAAIDTLIENVNKYRLLFEKSPVGIFHYDQEARLTDCNDKFVEILKSEKGKLIGLDLKTLKNELVVTAIMESLEGKQGSNEGYYNVLTSNAVIYAAIKTVPITDSLGNITGGMGIVEDITERKRTEEALRHSENRFRILSTLTTDAASSLTIGADGKFTRDWISVSLLKELGYEVEDIDSFEKWAEIVHPDDLGIYQDAVRRIGAGQKVSADFRIVKKNGEVIWVNNTVYPEVNDEGKVVRLISAIRNISEQVQAKQELLHQKNLLDLIINSAPLGIWVTTMDGQYPIINKWFADAIGYHTPNPSIRPEEIQTCFESDRIAYESEDPISTEEEVTFVDGKRHILQVLKRRLVSSNGQVIGIMGIGTDITDRKLFEKEMVRAIERAEDADRLKTAFLANMSHEIRTPLNGIIGFAKYLKDFPPSEEEHNHFLDIIYSSADHLLNIINDIIDISKLEVGQVKINPVPCNLNKTLDGIYSFFYTSNLELQKKDINLRLSTSLPEQDSNILIDDVRLKQVLNNLIGNAIKFTPKGYVEFGYTLVDHKKNLRFFVRDTGIGISPDKYTVIFERFRQADNMTTRNYGGTGLGLAISKSLIELMGGKIWVESKPNEGSVFYFTIPYQSIAKNQKCAESDQPIETYKKLFTGRVILVVEDDPNSIIYLNTMLENVGFKVINATSGRQSIEIVTRNSNIDLILMDLRLPEMSGFDAVREIRKINPTIPIIAETAHAFTEEKEMCARVGCNDFITKPIDVNHLYAAVYGQLRRKN